MIGFIISALQSVGCGGKVARKEKDIPRGNQDLLAARSVIQAVDDRIRQTRGRVISTHGRDSACRSLHGAESENAPHRNEPFIGRSWIEPSNK